ncbi:MAG: T9SS type A sorting domain-containing protein [Bacteroidales bacterium]|jgi:hypothetical protein|nr:T9SS type A sorting domain-containing protein [Bacteroidales bacterium]
MKTKFKLLSVISMLLVTVVSYAQQNIPGLGGGNGSSNDPYEIYLPIHLQTLSDYVKMDTSHHCENTFFIMTNDIDMSSVFNFVPIGGRGAVDTADDMYSFRGSFNGNNNIIYNLTIYANTSYVGLFGYTYNAVIKNLLLVNSNIRGGLGTGALVGYFMNYDGRLTMPIPKNTSSLISNCYVVHSNITSNNMIAGGLFGYIHYASIINSVAKDCEVNGSACVGGIGGILGDNTIMEKCYSSNNTINSSFIAGGVAGLVPDSNIVVCVVIDCYSTSKINTPIHCGALVGFISDTANMLRVANSFYNEEAWKGIYYDTNLASTYTYVGTPKSTAYMKTLQFVHDLNVLSVSTANDFIPDVHPWRKNYGYPIIGNEPEQDPYTIFKGDEVLIESSYTGFNPTQITIEDGGSLINLKQDNFVANVERELLNERYVFVGSPFGNITAGKYLGEQGDTTYNNVEDNTKVSMLAFNYNNNTWSLPSGDYNYLGYLSTMETGNAYLAYVMDEGFPDNLLKPQGDIIMQVHRDTLFNKTDTVIHLNNEGHPHTHESNIDGLWYSLANPYPANLWVKPFIMDNIGELSTYYLYVLENDQTFTPLDMDINNKITIGRGFFVSGYGGINNRFHSFMFGKNQLLQPVNKIKDEKEQIIIAVTSNNKTKKSYITIDERAKNIFDSYDAYKIFGINTDVCEPYLCLDSVFLAINTINSLPYCCKMGIYSPNNNVVSISFSSIPENIHLFFSDYENEIEIRNDFVYETTVTAGKNLNRFQIRLEKDNALANIDTCNFNIYPNPANDNLFIDGTGFDKVIIKDVLGKEILTSVKKEINIAYLARGIYNVQVISNSKIVKIKKIVKL